ncbi:hypothetical protein [Micromonospora sp. NPDC049679]|uniref:hypothetical protein n=1 Tax=Micromonospora sp. NPDC049679 TaxID=3155920 RepID=UPI0033EC13E6
MARIGALLAAGRSVIVVDPVIVNKADHELVLRMEPTLDLAASFCAPACGRDEGCARFAGR